MNWDNGAQIITPHDKNIQKSILDNLTPWENAWQECSVASDPLVSDPLDEINEHYFKVLSQACVKGTLNSETPLKLPTRQFMELGHHIHPQSLQHVQIQAVHRGRGADRSRP